jgi:23S rRNA pseudouridine1911/1915/1917 synthase
LYSRVNIAKKIKNGDVFLNGKKTKPSQSLEEGNILSLENFSREEEDKSLFKNADIELNVIFENEDFLVIDKQAGLQVHPSFNEKKNTLVNVLLFHFPNMLEVHDGSTGAELRPGIVHRLDRDTSGIMVIARNMEAFYALKDNFKHRRVEKKYLAIVHGILNEKKGVIKKPIAKSSSYNKQVIARANTKTTIRSAETHYVVLAEHENYSLLEVTPKTGRTHQIRIHLSSIGHAIVGDLIYGENGANDGVERQLLHAKELTFSLFSKPYEFSAPMPDDFAHFLAKVGKK